MPPCWYTPYYPGMPPCWYTLRHRTCPHVSVLPLLTVLTVMRGLEASLASRGAKGYPRYVQFCLKVAKEPLLTVWAIIDSLDAPPLPPGRSLTAVLLPLLTPWEVFNDSLLLSLHPLGGLYWQSGHAPLPPWEIFTGSPERTRRRARRSQKDHYCQF